MSDTKKWTKWVRSIVPIVGQASTEDAALLEVAYYAESVLFPGGKKIRAELVDSMLGPDHPTIFSVYPACPKAYMHPNVKPTMSSGGGGWANTLVSEDWVLQYPKCTGALAVTCDKIPEGTKCNNCQWQNAALKESCLDTLAHEHGHTMDLHRRKYIDKTGAIDDEAKRVFGDQPIEGPAWAASQYIMNPSREVNRGRKVLVGVVAVYGGDEREVVHEILDISFCFLLLTLVLFLSRLIGDVMHTDPDPGTDTDTDTDTLISTRT